MIHHHSLADKLMQSLDILKRCLSPLLSNAMPQWIEEEAFIEKKGISIVSRYWFGFISITLMPSQNDSILWHPKAALLGCIIAQE